MELAARLEDPELFDRSPIRWLILAAGLAASLYALRHRQPYTTSDFTIFYMAAAGGASDMYHGLRVNLNPPHFTLLLEPLSIFSRDVAAEVWRGLSLVSLAACLWWLGRHSDEPWSAADYGAVLAWAPFYHVTTLNQVTWIMWPLLLATWWNWRHDRWIAGAVWFGLILSFKSFLGVFLIWLALRGQWKAILVSIGTAAVALAVGIVAYGFGTFESWLQAMRGVGWTSAWSNMSLRALLLRNLSVNPSGSKPFVDLPQLVTPLFVVLAAGIVLATCWRMRLRSVGESWPAVTAAALLASPLGWLYYAWWFLPGVKPSRLLIRSPMLWIPMVYVTLGQAGPWWTMTYGSVYNWGLLFAWAGFVMQNAECKTQNAETSNDKRQMINDE